MPALRDLQNAFARAILSDDMNAISAWIADGPIALAERLDIHRNTMLGALTGALRLTYPAVDALVGPDFFGQAVRDFAREHPPEAPLLSLYGAAFPEFLASYVPAASVPYLPDVARLEWAVEVATQACDWNEAPPRAGIDLGTVRLALAPSLALLRTHYPAERIWRAVLEQNEAAIAALDPGPASSAVAVWRQGEGAAVVALGAVAAAFLENLIGGTDAEAALAEAATLVADGDPIAAIGRGILQAGFVRLNPIA